jgi:hypothetical protein
MLLLQSHFQSFLYDFYMFCLTFFFVSRKLAYFTINLCLLSVGLDLFSIKAAAGDAIMQLRFIGIQEHVRAGIVFHTHQGVSLRTRAFHQPALNRVPIIQPKRPIPVCADWKINVRKE